MGRLGGTLRWDVGSHRIQLLVSAQVMLLTSYRKCILIADFHSQRISNLFITMTADKRKRLNSVRFVNNPISKPSSDREKAVQVGRSLTVSRGRPTFCLFCKVRHFTLACPLINPVNSTTLPATLPPSAYQTRPPPTDPRTLQQKTRRCKRCRSQPPFIVEGILVERTTLEQTLPILPLIQLTWTARYHLTRYSQRILMKKLQTGQI